MVVQPRVKLGWGAAKRIIIHIFNYTIMMDELRQELTDEQLDEVAGGKKFTKKEYDKAKQQLTEAEKRAQQMMNQGKKRAFWLLW